MVTRHQFNQQQELAARIKIDIENLNKEKNKIMKKKMEIYAGQ